MDRGLACAIGASIVAHGLVLGFGRGVHESVEAPRVLDARLVSEQSPTRPPEPPRPEVVRPAAPEPRLRHNSAAPPQRVPHAVPVPRLVTDQRSDLSAPAEVAAPPPSPAPPGAAMAAPAPVAASGSPGSSSAGPVANAGAPAYSPPGFGASYLHNPKPAYPMMARRRGLEGVVRLDVRVSAEGVPIAVKVRDSSGHETLDEAALTAVWHWRFSPARRGGEPVEGAVVVPVRFNLEGDSAS